MSDPSGFSFVPAQDTVPASGQGQPVSISWQHPTGLFGFSMLAGLLRILTLGIYGFWAKAELRRRIWAATRIDGEPLRFTGTGGELFKGFLIAVFGVMLPLGVGLSVILAILPPASPAAAVALMVFYAIVYFLIGLATFTGKRYRLNRTTWRGIRAGLDGSALEYAAVSFGTALLVPLTLGWIIPWRAAKLNGLTTNSMRFGQTPFKFEAPLGPLYRNFAAIWLIAIISLVIALFVGYQGMKFFGPPSYVYGPDGTPQMVPPEGFRQVMLGIIISFYVITSLLSAWYFAVKMRYYAKHTQFAGAQFNCDVTAGGLIWLMLTNFLITFFSLGFLLPIAQARLSRYFVGRTTLEGPVDLAAVFQGAEVRAGRGEGLSQAFDLSPI